MNQRDLLIVAGRVVIAGVAVLTLAFVGRTNDASAPPELRYRPATPAEQLSHDLHREWELEQRTNGLP